MHSILKPATYADIEALPEHIIGEILFDRLVTSRRGGVRHCLASSAMTCIIGAPFFLGKDGPGDWIILNKPEIHLGPHVIVPDVAGWKRENYTEGWDGPWFETAPDWVCEVETAANRSIQAGPKRRIYTSHGVNFIWYVDPEFKIVEVFERQGPFWLLRNTFTGHEPISAPPFDAITFSLGHLWPFDPPTDNTNS